MKKIVIAVLSIVSLGLLFGCGGEATIKAYTRNTDSGTRDGFFTNIGFKEAIKDDSVLVDGYVLVDSNDAMIRLVSNDEYGIGYISLATLASAPVKGLSYNGVSPTLENVLNKSYMLTRCFNYMVRTDYKSEKEEQIVEAFIAFLGTKDAKITIKGKDGIIEIKDSDKTWNDIKDLYPVCQEDNSDITIYFGGSTSVEKMAKALSAEFSAKCGGFIPVHNHTGSGDAYKRTQGAEKDGTNYLDVAFASREFTKEEAVNENTFGLICTDAIVVIVNKASKLTNITAQTLKDIYSGKIKNWSEVE